MLGYLSADIICSEKRTVFRERSSRKTVSFEEQIMSNVYCVYYPSNRFRNTRSFENWGIFNNYSPKWRLRASQNALYPPISNLRKNFLEYNRAFLDHEKLFPFEMLRRWTRMAMRPWIKMNLLRSLKRYQQERRLWTSWKSIRQTGRTWQLKIFSPFWFQNRR